MGRTGSAKALARSARAQVPCGRALGRLFPTAPSPNRRRPARAGTMDSEAFQNSGDLLDLNFQCELG